MIKATITNTSEVNISDEEHQRLAMEYFCEKLKWKSNYVINDGWVFEKVVCYGSHKFVDFLPIREATAADVSTEKMFTTLFE